MELKDIKAVYFVGAGGIGMSAIARYFLNKSWLLQVTTRPLLTLHMIWKKKACSSIMRRIQT